MFVPHGVQADRGFRKFPLQLLKRYVQLKLHSVGHAQFMAQAPQHEDPVFILLVPTSADQYQLECFPSSRPRPPPVQHLSERPDLQTVILLWPELPDGNDGVALLVTVLLQRQVQEGADVTRRVDHAGAVRCAPQRQDVIQGPGGVHHDEIAARAGHAVEQREQAVIDHFEGAQEKTVGDVVRVVEPGRIAASALVDGKQGKCS